MNIREKRLAALYKYVESMNSVQRRELLSLIMAVIPHSIVKIIVEHLQSEKKIPKKL